MSGPLPSWTAPLTVPASWLYRVGVGWRNRRFDARHGVHTLPIPVISVGNLTVGGAGKSPLVRAIATRLLARGQRPVIALRGYGAKPGERSDEAQEHARLCPEVPVVVDPDRVTVLREHLETHPETTVAILDDGFQHRRLHRDLDVVVVDASRDALDGGLLPAGWLREPPNALRRAGAVVVTRAEHGDELTERIAALHGAAPVAWTRHAWTGVRVMEGGPHGPRPSSGSRAGAR